MATETATAPPADEHDEHDDPHAAHEASHPSDLLYVKVFVFLLVVTGIEVGLYYVDMSSKALIALLMPLMVVKFAGVVWYFMHLKFDSRTFSRLFVAGLILAVAVYAIALSTLGFL